jgi:hypothetical protein
MSVTTSGEIASATATKRGIDCGEPGARLLKYAQAAGPVSIEVRHIVNLTSVFRNESEIGFPETSERPLQQQGVVMRELRFISIILTLDSNYTSIL